MKPHGLSIILTFGMVGWTIAADNRHLRLALGIVSLTVTFYSFDYRYNLTLGAFSEMARALGVKPLDYLNSYFERAKAARKKT